MKHIKADQVKTCIVLSWDEFVNFVAEAFDGSVDVTYELDGISFDFWDQDFDDNAGYHEKIDYVYTTLEKFFGVKRITSIHADDDEDLGVWIVYEA